MVARVWPIDSTAGSSSVESVGPTHLDLYLSREDERPGLRCRSLNIAIVNITVIVVTDVLHTGSDLSFLLVHGDVRMV